MDDLTVRDRAHLAALEVTFPGWQITVDGGEWRAGRRGTPTAVQRAAGLVERVARPTPVALSEALAEQLGILVHLGDA
ncbi:hypothetical protein [Spongiactinospora sp. TRM90649]|uniref:hypothetical protein n=1 Tax=Spongiactinospora sp. TRM90649 TaxID=3031114 RepID=UPI0023F793DB|nr:hypothetical protein [Spongiactinospora sp. TRM90649]MDF5751298.1 hypothetical protein [Spongiactinospora sp. TRM90649]